MNIIAWNKTTDSAILPERLPLDSEWAFFDYGNGRTAKKQYNEPVVIPEKVVIPITVTSITGALISDIETGEVVVKELAPFTMTASVPLGVDVPFLVPIKRTDTGRIVYVAAEVVNDVMTATIALPTSGAWVCGEDEVNSNLSDEPFVFSFVGLNIKAVQ